MEKKSQKKLTWLLCLQGWAMLWVIIGHSVLDFPSDIGSLDSNIYNVSNSLIPFAVSFHMPLFFMISGYLLYTTRISRGWSTYETIYEKFLRLGIPYIFFIILAIIFKSLFPTEMLRPAETTFSGIMVSFLQPVNGAFKEMWFVASLFIYFLTYPVYKYLLKSAYSILFTIIAGIFLFYIPPGILTSWFAINDAAHYFIFFFLGLILKRGGLDSILCIPAVIIINASIYTVSFLYYFKLLLPISGSFTFWGIAILADRYLTSDLFGSFRNYTYQIFLIGIFSQTFVKILSRHFIFPGSYIFWWILCIIAGIYFPVLISKIGFIRNNSFTRRLLGLK